MHRREFLGTTLGALTLGGVAACVPHARAGVGGCEALGAAAYRRLRRFADTPFGRIAYVERGLGPAALFVHGFPLNGFQWRGALARLARVRRCVAPDLMGLGYSEVPDGRSVAPEAQVAMLAALLDRLRIRDVDVVANDSGGAVAQLLVAHHPARVRSLLLTNCDVESDSPPPSFRPIIAAARAGVFAERALVPALADRARTRGPQGMGGLAYTDPAHLTDEAIAYYFAPLVSSPVRKRQVEAYAIALERNPLEGIGPALARFDRPVRIVWGTGDTVFSPTSPGYLDRTFPRSRGVRRVEGAKLFFPEEFPDLIATEALTLWGAA